MDKLEEYFTELQEYFKENPDLFGIGIALLGIMLLIGALRDWNRLFGAVSGTTYSLKKRNSIIDWFGRKTGRICTGAGGIMLIIIGIGWFILYRYYF